MESVPSIFTCSLLNDAGIVDNSDITDVSINCQLKNPNTLVGFGPDGFIAAAASNTPSSPEPLKVTLDNLAAADTFVAISSSDSNLSVVGGGVTIISGTNSANVLLDTVAAVNPATLEASFNGVTLSADIRVIDATEVPRIVTIEPLDATVSPGQSLLMSVTLDFPGFQASTTVGLVLAPGNFASVPVTVQVPVGELSTSFNLDAGVTDGEEQITATAGGAMVQTNVTISGGSTGLVINEVDYDQPGSDLAEFVEIYNSGASPVSLQDISLVLVNGSTQQDYLQVDLSGMGTLGSGSYMVIGSEAVLSSGDIPVGVATLQFASSGNNIQNGAPDGVALVDFGSGKVIDVLSYEGEINAATISGLAGTVNLVEGGPTPESDSGSGSLARLPNGADTNEADQDWALAETSTPGSEN